MCHWNLNSIAAHNFSKLTLLEAYNMKYNFDIIRLSETYIDFSIQHTTKLVYGVGIYFKEFLATRQVELNNLNE